MSSSEILVLGVGNPLRGDDAAGPLVAEELGRRYADQLRARSHTGESLTMIEEFRGVSRVVVVDAVRSGATPGSVHVLDLHDEMLSVPAWTTSTHGFSLAETVELARVLHRIPERFRFYGIEAEDLSLGAPVTEAVRIAIPEVVKRIAGDLGLLPVESASGPRKSTPR